MMLAQDEVERACRKLRAAPTVIPAEDPVKAQALSVLDAAKKKRDKALATLNWY